MKKECGRFATAKRYIYDKNLEQVRWNVQKARGQASVKGHLRKIPSFNKYFVISFYAIFCIGTGPTLAFVHNGDVPIRFAEKEGESSHP